MVKGKTISERVHDISQIELACMIRNYATALSNLGEYQAFGDSEFSDKNVLFKGEEGLHICGYVRTKMDI